MTKKERITGIVLASILLLTVINSTYYFLGIVRVNLLEWIVLNACAPSSIAFMTGLLIYFLTSERMWLTIAVVPMMFFGTMGLFVFPWSSGTDLLVQFSHITMTANIVFGLWIVLKNRDYKALGTGLLISISLFIPYIAFTQAYCREHAESVMKYLGI